MTDITDSVLESIGLSKSEVKIYLASLALGPSSIIHIGQETGLTRQAVYTLLPDMLDKGMMKAVEVSGKKFYQALGPEVLKDRAKKISRQIDEIVPVLKTRQAENSAIPLITIYENPLSMREWYRKFMFAAEENEDLLIWSSGRLESWYDLDREFYDKYLLFSEKGGLKTLVLLPNTAEAREYQRTLGKPSTKYRFVEHGASNNAEKWVWRDQICYLTIKENATNMIVIESKSLADIERQSFKSVWKSADQKLVIKD